VKIKPRVEEYLRERQYRPRADNLGGVINIVIHK